MNKGIDGLHDEFLLGFVFEGGLDLVFERLPGRGTGFGGVCEFGFDQIDTFFRSPEGGDFDERCLAGDAFLLDLEVADAKASPDSKAPRRPAS